MEQVKVKNPTPDLTYRKEALTDPEQTFNSSHNARLSNNLDHAVFVVEAKSAEKPIEATERQDARAGAAMTWCRRNFNDAVNNSGDKAAADIPTSSFTATHEPAVVSPAKSSTPNKAAVASPVKSSIVNVAAMASPAKAPELSAMASP